MITEIVLATLVMVVNWTNMMVSRYSIRVTSITDIFDILLGKQGSIAGYWEGV